LKNGLFVLSVALYTSVYGASEEGQGRSDLMPVDLDCELKTGEVFVDCISSDWRFPSYFEMPTDGSPGREVMANEDYHHFIQVQLIQGSQADRGAIMDVRYSDKSANALFRFAPSEKQGYPADLRSFRTGRLEFDIKVLDWGQASDISISVECGWPCTTGDIPLDIDEVGIWKSYSYSAQELIEKGLNLSRLSSAVNFIPSWDRQQGVHYQLDNLRWVAGEMNESAPYAPADYWSERAKEDLAFIYQVVREDHPGALDDQNLAFREYAEDGYQSAFAMAEGAKTEADYRTTIRYYMAGFADSHFQVSFNESLSGSGSLWPGMNVSKQGDRYLVNSVMSEDWQVPLPESGAELVSCDGRKVDALLSEDVLYYYFRDSSINAAKANYAPRLFRVDDLGSRTPYKECVFSYQGQKHTYEMYWSAAPKSHTNPVHERHRKAYPTSAKIDEVAKGVYWVYLPTFRIYTEEEIAEFKVVLKKLKSLPEPRTLIMDVRFNDGGNSGWAREILYSLHGSMALNGLLMGVENEHFADFRLSDRNIDYVKSREGRTYQSLYPKLKAAKEQGKTWYSSKQNSGVLSRVLRYFFSFFRLNSETNIVLLTSPSCGSACLDFADLVLLLPNTAHLGEETSADTLYMDVNLGLPAMLPSGLGHLIYPMKVWRKRFRDHNESYVPELRYESDIYNTDSVKEWVLKTLSRTDF